MINQEFLSGIVERITFNSEETGYSVARLKAPKHHDLVTIVGSFANLQAGQTLQLKGIWKEHPTYGQQFQVIHYEETKPANLTGMEKYLGSGLIKGVGTVTAKRIVAHFGLETLDIIEHEIERLIEVQGIGKKRVNQIKKAWHEQKEIKEVMVFLQGHGVSTTYAVKIYKQYGDKAIETVKHNPYQLAVDIFGIGFLTADKIARNIGIKSDAINRYQAGILHVLGMASEDGHCFLPQPELVQLTITTLSIDDYIAEESKVLEAIKIMVKDNNLVVEKAEGEMNLCYKPSFYHTEVNLANLIKKHLVNPVQVDITRVRNWLARFTASRKIELSPQQYQGVIQSASQRMMILTGGPGCGKTFTTHTIVSLWKAMGKKIGLAAPTGRAAQRLSEMTGLEAKTLHRLLEFDPRTMGFKRDKNNPLPFDALVVDEASMLDLFLAYSLLKAIPDECQLLLVGDVDQLPSVGAGNVLKDLINSGQIPVVKLTQVFRQAEASAIIKVAHQINQGNYPYLEPISATPKTDCLWHNGGFEPAHGVQVISELLTDFIPQLGFNVSQDVQLLTPMTRGEVGTRNLNQVMQQLLNPPTPEKMEVSRGGTIFRVGDRIIQLKNDYNKEVFNGDLGIINKIDTVEQELMIQFGDRLISYDFGDLNEINLGFCLSIHKSQGSEYPVIILPLYMSHYVLLSRNLFYTGLTRAKKLAIIVGSKKAIALAVNQLKEQLRYTRLTERLLN
jgi:exodeoxyribonuclease V alpha subunit